MNMMTRSSVDCSGKRARLQLLALAGLLWLAGALPTRVWPAMPPRDERPNIVLAIADDWGWPHASAYGDAVVETPTFDRIAREGVLFHHAFVSSPSCTPSRGAIITGQHFWRLGPAANLWSVWPADQFAEYPRLLQNAGYHVGSYRKGWGPGRGNPAGKKYASLDAFFQARPDGAPFCLWFGSSDPHRPYEAGSGQRSGMDMSQVHLFAHLPDVPQVRSDIADYYWEVQRFDRELGQLVQRLTELGEWENTLIVVTGDHGMPFPRCKANVYDSGARVPLAIRWGSSIAPGRRIDDLVSLTDLAPTFLEAAGLDVPQEMTGRSLLNVLRSDTSGQVDPLRDHVLIGRERHVPAQERGNRGGYPVRALRTKEFLLVHNLAPDRWPAGTPDWQRAHVPRAWLADCDNGPTKDYLWDHRHDPAVAPAYQLSFAKRPAFELYDLRNDPDQIHNVAGRAEYAAQRAALIEQLEAARMASADPRQTGGGQPLDTYPYLGGAPQWERE